MKYPGAVVSLLTLQFGAAAPQTWNADSLHEFLGFTPVEWRDVERGGIVAKTLKTKHGREVAVLGAAKAPATAACFVARFEDIETFRTASIVRKVHKIPLPPRATDLEALTLDKQELSSLRDCREGHCGTKLPADAMAAIGQSEVDANTAFRRWLFAYLGSYLDRGNAALAEYNDKDEPIRLQNQFHALLDAEPSLSRIAPEFYSYLADYPGRSLEDVSDFMYWAEDDFGLKPVISVTHASIYRRSGEAIIASKQIYASHYYEGSLGLTFLREGAGESPESMYIVYLNRSRIDLLGGWLGGIRRAFLRGRLLDGFRQNLRDVVRRLDSCKPSPSQ